MGAVERLIHNYDTRVSLPWERNLAGPQRVWFAVYNKAEERRLRRRLEEFEISTRRAKHGWITIDLTDAFATWLSQHEYRNGYLENPEHLEGDSPVVDEFKSDVTERVLGVLASPLADGNTVVAIHGIAGLFGFMKTSELIEKVENAIQGRLLVFFPGEYDNNTYRFLDAREGWNYLAVPITSDDSTIKT